MPNPVTSREMHRVFRKRQHKSAGGWAAIVASEIPPGSHDKEEMLGMLRQKLSARGDRGIGNLMKELVLEARNPFEPTRRRAPKREIVSVASLVAILFAAVVWFNFVWR
jgi:hypothetical protein